MTPIPGDTDADNYVATDLGNTNVRLRSFFERCERIQADRDDLLTDLREVLKEAQGEGYDPKVIRAVLRLRKQDPTERQEFEALVELYLNSVGG